MVKPVSLYTDAAFKYDTESWLISFPFFLTSVNPGQAVGWKNTFTLTSGIIQGAVTDVLLLSPDVDGDGFADIYYNIGGGESTSITIGGHSAVWVNGEYNLVTGETLSSGKYYLNMIDIFYDQDSDGKFDFGGCTISDSTLSCPLSCVWNAPHTYIICDGDPYGGYASGDSISMPVLAGPLPVIELAGQFPAPDKITALDLETWTLRSVLSDFVVGVVVGAQDATFEVGYAAPDVTLTMEVWVVILAAATAGLTAVGYAVSKLKP